MTTMLKAFLAAKVKDVKAPVVAQCLRAAQRATNPRRPAIPPNQRHRSAKDYRRQPKHRGRPE